MGFITINTRMKWLIFLFLIINTVYAKSLSKKLDDIIKKDEPQTKDFLVTINGYSPTQDDDYVSVAIKAEPGYIVRFEPVASADRIHHILLYGCTTPAYNSKFWKGGATCYGPSHILYAWARNAPSLDLPNDVAFPIGNEGDAVQYIVMQIHYAHPFNGKIRDFSGVRLHLSNVKPKYVAQVYLFVSGDPIPPKLDAAYNNMSCYYQGDSVLHPFAFRTHTHAMGRVVSAYFKHDTTWKKIGKRNPQWPQLFQQVDEGLTIQKGDFMSAMCRFDSHDKDEAVPMGSMGVDEMCNFYMMFYRDANEPDPFPNGAVCGFNENPQLMATEYPTEGTTLLPSHPELEHHAHQASKPLGIVDKFAIKQLGDVTFGQISGMAFDNDGNLVIFHRGSRVWGQYTFDNDNQLLDRSAIVEPTIIVAKIKGDGLVFEKALGENLFYMPHGIFVDQSNYYYTTDVGSHEVIKWKLTSDGKLQSVFTLGERFVPGSDQKHFCKPAAVAVSKKDGSIFVADGYCNNRVMHFTKNGDFVAEFGESSYVPGKQMISTNLGTFNLPHDITLDEEHDKIFVADRENGRVQAFTMEGKPLYEMKNPEYFGNVYSLDYCPNHGLYFIPGLPTREANEINVFGVPLGADIFEFSFKGSSGDFHRPHILRARDNSVYVGEIEESGGILWRFDIDQEAQTPMDMNMTFKPLRTEDGGTDEESDDDLGISSTR